MHRFLVLLWIASILAGCAVAPGPTPEPSAWRVTTLARAQQGDPPVIWADTNSIAAVWVGADEAGVHENAVRLTGSTLGPVTVLPLPPRHPYALSGAPGTNGDLHLLWLDANESGEMRLFSALLTPNFTVERGPTAISDRLALRYAISPVGDGSLWTAWSGGLPAEPTLYAQIIDADGRPRPPIRVAADANEPALTRSEDGTVAVYWLGASDGQVYRATLTNDGSSDMQTLTAGIHLEAGDRLDSLRAGLDQTHAYLFWNVTRTDGSAEVWLASGAITASEWSQPRRLLLTGSDAAGETPCGSVTAASLNGIQVRRVGPATGQHDLLPVAAEIADRVKLLTFRSGTLTGAEDVCKSTGLVAPPSLTVGADGEMIVAWAEPGVDGEASLNVAVREAPSP